MDLEKNLKNKSKKIKLYKVFDIFIRSVLTFVGTVTGLSMLMFLNSKFNVSYFTCFVMSSIMPSIYSFFVNESLEDFDNKIKNMEYELENEKLLEDLINKENINYDYIKQIEFRFDGLSNESKLILLNYIKEFIPDNRYSQYINDIDNLDSITLDDILEEDIYSKKKVK